MKKSLSWILIIAGIIVLLYPTFQSQYYQYKQNKLLSSWEESLLVVDSIDTDTEVLLEFDIDDENITDLSDLSSISINDDVVEPVDSEVPKTEEDIAREEEARLALEEAAKLKAEYIQRNMEGILIIDRIDLKQPIIRGASAKNMLLTVTSFENTGIPGEIGNYAIIGHRNLTYGRNFNRLDEIEIGDELHVITELANYTYVVTDIFLVLPDDVGVLFGTNLEKRITLITCDPKGAPTHRLIVRGKIIE